MLEGVEGDYMLIVFVCELIIKDVFREWEIIDFDVVSVVLCKVCLVFKNKIKLVVIVVVGIFVISKIVYMELD